MRGDGLSIAFGNPKKTMANSTGGDRGCSSWRRPSTALQVAYPTHPPKNTLLVEYGGGGQVLFTVASPKHGTERRLSPP